MPVAWLLWDVAVGDALVQAHLLGFNAVNPHFSTVDEEVVARARELELDVNVWTVNPERTSSGWRRWAWPASSRTIRRSRERS